MTNNRNSVLYVGVTNNLETRVFDHKVKRDPRAFTARYNCNKLVYFEEFGDINNAIHREKQLKKYHRAWKIELIEKSNVNWSDLSSSWYRQDEFELYKKFDK